MSQRRGPNPLLLGGIAAALAAVYFVGRDVYDAQFLDWKIQDFSLTPGGGTLSMGIINGTPSTYTLQTLNLDINMNDTRIATAVYGPGQLVIMPNATTTLQLNIKPDLSGVLQIALSAGEKLIQSQDPGSQKFTAVGSAQVDGIMLPVNTTLGVVQA